MNLIIELFTQQQPQGCFITFKLQKSVYTKPSGNIHKFIGLHYLCIIK